MRQKFVVKNKEVFEILWQQKIFYRVLHCGALVPVLEPGMLNLPTAYPPWYVEPADRGRLTI